MTRPAAIAAWLATTSPEFAIAAASRLGVTFQDLKAEVVRLDAEIERLNADHNQCPGSPAWIRDRLDPIRVLTSERDAAVAERESLRSRLAAIESSAGRALLARERIAAQSERDAALAELIESRRDGREAAAEVASLRLALHALGLNPLAPVADLVEAARERAEAICEDRAELLARGGGVL